MTIQEAVKSYRPAKRKTDYQYYYFVERRYFDGACQKRTLSRIGIEDADEAGISMSDILAEDWEIKQ